MNGFHRRANGLCAEGVTLANIAREYGTPTYVYSAGAIRDRVVALNTGLGNLDHLVCYAVKACSNIAILELIAQAGWGFDAVSKGELWRTLKAGADPRRTIQSGVGKTDDEIDEALGVGVLYICVESGQELAAVSARAAHLNKVARIALRINPDVDPHTHPHISTGLKKNKFGVPHAEVIELLSTTLTDRHIDVVGISCHIGSQITKIAPFVEATHKVIELAGALENRGHHLTHLGVGGGLGITYVDEAPPTLAEYGASLAGLLVDSGKTIVLEPGRAIVGEAGVLLARVIRTKRGADRDFVILDAGMNDLIRPALYNAHHTIEPVAPQNAGPLAPVDVVGPICEASDTFAQDVVLPPLVSGDLVVIRAAGAYGSAMSSPYNGRSRTAEVLCDGSRSLLIREREPLTALWRGERHLNGEPLDDDRP